MKSSISDYEKYKNVCIKAVEDDLFFKSFRSNNEYMGILEHVSYESGLEYYKHCVEKNKVEFTNDLIKKLKKTDYYGLPNRYKFEKIDELSPTILRYISVASDIHRLYGPLDGKTVVEIGAGYGGQSMLINLLYNIKKYIIIDLPEVIELIKKFLTVNNMDIEKYEFYSYPNIPTIKTDFLISNYAFSECYKSVQDIYIKNLINNSKNFYMVVNFISNDVYNKEELLQMLNGNIVVTKEEPITTDTNLLFYKKD